MHQSLLYSNKHRSILQSKTGMIIVLYIPDNFSLNIVYSYKLHRYTNIISIRKGLERKLTAYMVPLQVMVTSLNVVYI